MRLELEAGSVNMAAMRRRYILAPALFLCGACGGGPVSPSPPTRAIAFLGSQPAPGSTIVTSNGRPLDVRVSVLFDSAIPKAQLWVELLNAAGESCGLGQSEPFDVVAGHAVTALVHVSFLISPCPRGQAESAPRLHARLFAYHADPQGQRVASDYLASEFPVAYMLRRYPPPPSGQGPAPPRIDSLTWNSTGWADTPGPGDPVTVYCAARDPEGDAVTVTLEVTWKGRAPRTVSTSFPPGASASVPGAQVSMYTAAHDPPTAKVKCSVTDAHGASAARTTTVP
jgi:hypothetical protein